MPRADRLGHDAVLHELRRVVEYTGGAREWRRT
jgi:hypothetical protein